MVCGTLASGHKAGYGRAPERQQMGGLDAAAVTGGGGERDLQITIETGGNQFIWGEHFKGIKNVSSHFPPETP